MHYPHEDHDLDQATVDAQAEDAAFKAGRAARYNHKPAHANPHHPSQSLWVEWDAGWEDADYEIPPGHEAYEMTSNALEQAAGEDAWQRNADSCS